MGLQSIDHLLGRLLNQDTWAHQKRLIQVTQCWRKILPAKSQANSLPVQIIDDVLWVATPNHTWSQHLNLQRRHLLARLNVHLAAPLKDLRFSTVHWHRKPAYSPLAADPNLPHPSTLPEHSEATINPQEKPQDPVAAVQRWAEAQQQRFHGLPPCPHCQKPTPPGELQRWQMCVLCIVQVWQREQANFCLGLPPTDLPSGSEIAINTDDSSTMTAEDD